MPTPSIDSLIDLGIQAQTDRQWALAQKYYDQARALNPHDPDVLHLLGVLHHQIGHPQQAIELLTAAVNLDPTAALFHFNLAEALRVGRQLSLAVDHYRLSLTHDPEFANPHLPLTEVLIELDNLQDARQCLDSALRHAPPREDLLRVAHCAAAPHLSSLVHDICRQILDHSPDHPAALLVTAKTFAADHEFQKAAQLYARLVQLAPAAETYLGLASAYAEQRNFSAASATAAQGFQLYPAAFGLLFILGYCAEKSGDPEKALEHYQTILKVDPSHISSRINVSVILRTLGQPRQALKELEIANRQNPDNHDILINLATTSKVLGNFDDAENFGLAALALKPDHEATLCFLAILFHSRRDSARAVDLLHRCLTLHPRSADAHANLGTTYLDRGQLTEAAQAFRDCLAVDPQRPDIHSNLLLTLTYDDTMTPRQVFDQHLQWDRDHSPPSSRRLLNPASNRKLRIGYVSPDFRQHVAVFFIGPMLINHDRSAFDVFCYSDVTSPDKITSILQSLGHQWRNIAGLSNDRAFDMIQKDQIDILVDLTGHTANNRLPLFARRARAIQVTMVGYPNTTGLAAMDYQITDSHLHPLSQTETFASETLLRLPEIFACYRAPDDVPPVGPLPALTAGHVTFGSFNNLAKLRPPVLRAWAQIAARLPTAQFIIQATTLGDPASLELLRQRCLDAGLPLDRLSIRPPSDFALFFHNLSAIDIGLDPFPFNGHTTSCQMLHMGVPLITLAGATRSGRMGLSLLSNLKLAELIAHSPEQYVHIAVGLAQNLPRLAALRTSLRPRMENSPVMNERTYTHNIETAFRQIAAKAALQKE